MKLEGLCIPPSWLSNITTTTKNGNKKTDYLACLLLAEIISYYPHKNNDYELDDAFFHISYADLGKVFNIENDVVRNHLKTLESIGILQKKFIERREYGFPVQQVMYVRLNAPEVARISEMPEGQKAP